MGQGFFRDLSMSVLSALFDRRAPRHYALLDEQGHCRMLFTAKQRPHGECWVEIPDICLGWIGKPLPADLRERSGSMPQA